METETLLISVGDSVAVQDAVGAPTQTTAIQAREIAYFYTDSTLTERYPVYAARNTSWWMDSGVKLQSFMAHIKKRHTVKQSLFLAGISFEQYRDFYSLHPWFATVIRYYKSLVPMAISDVILEAALGDSKRGIKPNAKIALGAARLYPNVEDEPEFADIDGAKALPIPPGGAKITNTNEAVLDAEGNVVASRRSLELLKHHDGGNNES